MVIVTIAPDGFLTSSLPDQRKLPLTGEATGDGFFAVAEDGDGDHRLWFPQGDEPIEAAVLIPLDRYFFWRTRAAQRLARRLHGKPSGSWPQEQRLSIFQLHRAALMLRAWDGVASGVSRRHIASVLLNRDVEALRAVDWQNAPERRRLARILAAARDMIDGGYLRWLAPRKPRR